MKYEKVPHVRLYKWKDAVYRKLGWEGRTVLWHIRLEADPLGRVAIREGSEVSDIARKLDVGADVMRVALPKLFEQDVVRWESSDGKETPGFLGEQGVSKCEGGAFRVVDFEVSEAAPRSNWLRGHEFRKKRQAARKETLRLRRKRVVSKKRMPVESITAAHAAERGFITRRQAAIDLNVSLATLRRREGVDLKTYRTELGEHVFDPATVHALALKSLPGADTPERADREPPAEPGNHPVWRERAARLAERIGSKQLSAEEVRAIGRKLGLKDSITDHTLAAAEGLELVKTDGKWSAAKAVKP